MSDDAYLVEGERRAGELGATAVRFGSPATATLEPDIHGAQRKHNRVALESGHYLSRQMIL